MVSYLHAFSAIIGLGINVVCQVCTCRYITGFGLLKSIFVGFVFGICSLIFIELYCLSQAPLSLLGNVSSIFVNVITYSALGYGYFHFINLGETARRIRILRELYDSKEGFSMEEIINRYNAEEIVDRRIDRLVNNGQIIFRNGKFYIGRPSMLYIARIIVILKLLFLGKRSEFD